jgi:hypothetical protein
MVGLEIEKETPCENTTKGYEKMGMLNRKLKFLNKDWERLFCMSGSFSFMVGISLFIVTAKPYIDISDTILALFIFVHFPSFCKVR